MRQCSPAYLRKIIEVTSKVFNVPVNDILSHRRTRSLMPARHIAMWLCKHHTAASYPQIGDVFCGMNHSSIMHGVFHASKMIENNDDLAIKALTVSNIIKDLRHDKAGN